MKKILVATPYLHSGGVEVSLIRFLKELSKNKNLKITLLLLKKEGMYLKDVPKNIEIISVIYDDDIYSYEHQIKDIKNIKGIRKKFNFLMYRLKLRNYLKKDDWENYYTEILKYVKNISTEYDLAIDFHGYGHLLTTIIADKVTSKKKTFWINDEKNEWIYKINKWINKFDKIFCVGIACRNSLIKKNKILGKKVDIFYNMTDYVNIRQKALEPMDFNYDRNKFDIITVGRLEWQKAYDVAVLIAKKLKEKGFNFCWYAIGTGHKKAEIEDLIKQYNLENHFKLLGVKKNPFPYVKQADAYVLASRHEGYCLATLEAKILGKIIIATDIESNREQITSYQNGILCKLDPEEFADKIIEVASNKALKSKIEQNLAKENFDYTKEFEKLYKLMEE